MIKNTAFLLICFFALNIFSSCEKEECFFGDHDEESIAPSALLTNGIWDLQMISYREFEDGKVGDISSEPFGTGTENGECTFEFTTDLECTMIDDENEESYRFAYLPKDRIRIGDEIYAVKALTEDELELVVFYYEGDCSEEVKEDEEKSGKEEHFYFSR